MIIDDVLSRLRERPHVPMFVADEWDEEQSFALAGAELQTLFGTDRPIVDPQAAACAVAGLHLWNDNWEMAHQLCQAVQTPTGSYWHGLCHRREGHRGEGLQANLSNARYWFRQTGTHPAFDAVYRSALGVLDSTGSGFRWATEAANSLRQRGHWDPNAIIDWFAQADAGTLSPQSQSILEEIQWREMDLLVDWCYQRAIGG